MEFFRGKDFMAYFKQNPDKLDNIPGIEPLKPGGWTLASCQPSPGSTAVSDGAADVELWPQHRPQRQERDEQVWEGGACPGAAE